MADTLFTYDEQNPLDKEVMASVISQTVSYFPADSYGFVFLSHSSSWVPASNNANSRSIGYYRRTQMNIPDFREALSSAFPKLQSPNQKIPDRKTKCVIKTHINIKQNVIFGAKLKPV